MMADPDKAYSKNVPRKGPTEPLMPRRGASPELDDESEFEDDESSYSDTLSEQDQAKEAKDAFVDRDALVECMNFRRKGSKRPVMPRREASSEVDAESDSEEERADSYTSEQNEAKKPEDAFVDRDALVERMKHIANPQKIPSLSKELIRQRGSRTHKGQMSPTRKSFRRKGSKEPVMPRREGSPELDAESGTEDEHAPSDRDTLIEQDQAEEIEKELDHVLRKGDFDAINEKVTPKTLSRCKTNTLLKAFQVNKALRDLAGRGIPEKDDIEKLEKSVNEFTSALVDPLKTNADNRKAFQSCLDCVVDEAIDTKQKKFLSHSVMNNLLNSRWYGSFSSVRKESWRKARRWGYFLLNLWAVFDIIFFPFFFAVFFVVHLLKQDLRKRGIKGKDIYEKYKDYFTTPYFVFLRDTLSYLMLLGLHCAICLSPPTVSFSQPEWVILFFFLGRILMEVDQFIAAQKAGVKVRKMQKRYSPGDQPEENGAGDDNILLKQFISYFSDRWNVLDFVILVLYLITFTLRIITGITSTNVSNNRLLAVSGYFYGFIAMFLTLRAFGQVIECARGMGAIQIALFSIIWDVMAIFWQFLATILAFSLAMTKIYVAEKVYMSGEDSAEDFWWNMAKHLSWSLLGIADLDKLNSVDNPSVSLIHLLYSVFLIMAVILLVNMMIALVSNTYQQVQNNSLQEWSFKRAITVRTYSTYHPIPVPFNIFSVPLKVLWNLPRKRSYKTCFDSSALDEEGQSEALDKVVKKLESIYFQKFGYEFPLTEDKKINYLVQVNEGGRKMTYQIVRQVFRPRGNKEEELASGQRAWYDSPGIAVDGCLLTYKGPDFCDTCKRGIPKHIHSAKFKSSFTPETPRFEVLIQETGKRRIIALGAVRESYDAVDDCHTMPGWDSGTVGYHVYHGKIFETGCRKKGREVEGAMAYRGDLIACEVDFESNPEGKISVMFSLNGREIGRCWMKCTSKLIPFISLGSKGITVLTKMRHRDRDRFSRETIQGLQEQLDEQKRILLELRNLVLSLKEKGESSDCEMN